MTNIIIGALIGFLSAFLGQHYFISRRLKEDIVDDYVEDLKIIEGYCVAYWLGNSKEHFDTQKKIAAKIRGSLQSTYLFIEMAPTLVGQNNRKSLADLDGKLFDVSTGGAFETSKQEPDYSRVTEIMTIIRDLRFAARSARAAIYFSK